MHFGYLRGNLFSRMIFADFIKNMSVIPYFLKIVTNFQCQSRPTIFFGEFLV